MKLKLPRNKLYTQLIPLALITLAVVFFAIPKVEPSLPPDISQGKPIKKNAHGALIDCWTVGDGDCKMIEWIVVQCIKKDTHPKDCFVYD